MAQELNRFRMNVTGIRETKWFGQAVYEVEGYTIPNSQLDIKTQENLKQPSRMRELA